MEQYIVSEIKKFSQKDVNESDKEKEDSRQHRSKKDCGKRELEGINKGGPREVKKFRYAAEKEDLKVSKVQRIFELVILAFFVVLGISLPCLEPWKESQAAPTLPLG